jgi:small-conductance mechanosensitive channel
VTFLSFPLAEIDVTSWLDYPLVRFSGSAFTVLSLSKLLCWIAGLFVLNTLLRRLILLRLLARTQLDAGVQFAVTKIFSYVFLALGVYVALVVNGVNLSSLAVVAGALGVGIGFGLQNIVSNFVSGIILLVERPVAIGDRIEVAGVAGRVTRINLRSTIVVTNDNITIIVPNSDLVTNPVTNWSHGDPKVQFRLPVGVAYGSDVEKLRRVLLDLAAENPDVLKTPAPTVYFDNFGDSSLNFELGVWTQEMAHSPRRFRSALNFAIEQKLRENNIEIPFPQRVVHLRPSGPAAGDNR